jgi:hypothetical protein
MAAIAADAAVAVSQRSRACGRCGTIRFNKAQLKGQDEEAMDPYLGHATLRSSACLREGSHHRAHVQGVLVRQRSRSHHYGHGALRCCQRVRKVAPKGGRPAGPPLGTITPAQGMYKSGERDWWPSPIRLRRTRNSPSDRLLSPSRGSKSRARRVAPQEQVPLAGDTRSTALRGRQTVRVSHCASHRPALG